MWQPDFTQFKMIGWGWYYLCTVLDDLSRYILAWRLAPTMASDDVKKTLDIARERTGITEQIVVKLDNYYFPWELEQAIAAFVDYYDHHRYHEALDNMIPADVYFGRAEEMRTRRAQIKHKTLQERRNFNLHMAAHSV
jgi:transposase InsO family protein